MTALAALLSEPIRPEAALDDDAVRAVVARAFGPGHLARTAERLREGQNPVAGFTAWRDARMIGTVRLWPIRVGEASALFLGPIAVERADRNGGVGAELVRACLDWADASAACGVLLVGDPPYFERFGFVRAADAFMPGPVDPRRVLWRGRDGQGPPEGRVIKSAVSPIAPARAAPTI